MVVYSHIISAVHFLSAHHGFISACSLVVGAFTALYTSVYIKRRDESRANTELFRSIYKEFWEDDDVTFIRRCLINIREYPKLGDVLKSRNLTAWNELSIEDNDIIDKMDRFCATLIRIKSIDMRKMRWEQKVLWQKTLNSENWIIELNKSEETKTYIEKHWNELNTITHNKRYSSFMARYHINRDLR